MSESYTETQYATRKTQARSDAHGETTSLTASGIDQGWVFCFFVVSADADKAEALLNKIYANASVNLQRLAVEDMQETFRPEASKETVFLVRQTRQTHVDIGMLAGQVEDAFRDENIIPGALPKNMAKIQGVSYTTYRNETDPEGQLLSTSEWQELAKARPPHQLYNPFVKPDPWSDIVYEYAPSDVQLEAPSQTASSFSLVEDFDLDLGTLLSKVFSGIDENYLTQPESSKGWMFDQSYGCEPYYVFYACPTTIKPVRQTLRQAGIVFHHTEQGDWHGVVIPKEHFEIAQKALMKPGIVEELNGFYKQCASYVNAPSDTETPYTDANNAHVVSDI